jgi:hypothetical protein
MMRSTIVLAGLTAVSLFASGCASTSNYYEGGSYPVSASYDPNCDYYSPPWGYPSDYCQYQLWNEPVFYSGSWYSGPIYYRNVGGANWFWLNGNWRRDEWRGARPRIDWNRGGNVFWRGDIHRGGRDRFDAAQGGQRGGDWRNGPQPGGVRGGFTRSNNDGDNSPALGNGRGFRNAPQANNPPPAASGGVLRGLNTRQNAAPPPSRPADERDFRNRSPNSGPQQDNGVVQRGPRGNAQNGVPVSGRNEPPRSGPLGTLRSRGPRGNGAPG